MSMEGLMQKLVTTPLPNGKAVVSRVRTTRSIIDFDKVETVLVPITRFDSVQAAELYVDGQNELTQYGDSAGYDRTKKTGPIADTIEDEYTHL
jgi:hypothetical protein